MEADFVINSPSQPLPVHFVGAIEEVEMYTEADGSFTVKVFDMSSCLEYIRQDVGGTEIWFVYIEGEQHSGQSLSGLYRTVETYRKDF